jgi:hypothetical protein
MTPASSGKQAQVLKEQTEMQIESVIAALTDTRQNLEALKRIPGITTDRLNQLTAFVNDLESTVSEILADTPPTNAHDLDAAISRTTENIDQTQNVCHTMDTFKKCGSPDESLWINTARTCVEALKWHLQYLIEARVRLMGTASEVRAKFGQN